MSDRRHSLEWRRSRLNLSEPRLCGLCDFSSLDASRADSHPVGAALGKLHANRLEIWIKSPRSAIICMRHIIAELGTFAADFTTFGHYYLQPPGCLSSLISSSSIIQFSNLPQSET